MSRTVKRRVGVKPKWGEPTRQRSIYWPYSHLELYERLARERGMSMSEYVVRSVADSHELKLPQWEDSEQLLLGA